MTAEELYASDLAIELIDRYMQPMTAWYASHCRGPMPEVDPVWWAGWVAKCRTLPDDRYLGECVLAWWRSQQVGEVAQLGVLGFGAKT